MRDILYAVRNDLMACQSGLTPLPISLTMEKAIGEAVGEDVRALLPYRFREAAAKGMLQASRYHRTFADALDMRHGLTLMMTIGCEAYERIREQVGYNQVAALEHVVDDPEALPRQTLRGTLLCYFAFQHAGEAEKADRFLRMVALMRRTGQIVLGEHEGAGRWTVLTA